MRRIAVDMDDVLAETGEKLLGWARQNLASANFDTVPDGQDLIHLLSPDDQHRLHDELQSPDFFCDIPVMKDSQAVLQDLQAHFEIFIATAAMEFPNCFGPKFTWLRKHFPFLNPMNFVFCGDKSVLQADFLIDDRERHFTRFCGEGILFSAPHNRLTQGYRRVENWRDAHRLLLSER